MPAAGDAATSLDPAGLRAEAERRLSTRTPASFSFDEPLERLTSALEDEAALTVAGRRTARRALVGSLVTQSRVAALVGADPGLTAAPVERPVFVTGLPRTGTTLLHHLLAQHPRLHAPALWELLAPAGPGDEGRLVRDAAAYVDEYYRAAPAFRAIHPLDANDPEECHRLTENAFLSEIFAMRYRVPGYAGWLRRQDARAAYAYHHDQLRCILRRRPARRVVLKCPFHTWHLDELAATYPDAVVVRIHRDPVAAVTSACSLTAAIRAARTDRVDPHEIGRWWLTEAERVAAGLAAPKRYGVGVLDLRFDDLMRDPLGVVAQVCAFVGEPFPAAAAERVHRYLAAHPRGRDGAHRYRPEQFGLLPEELTARFATYRSAFDL
jgi:hypothetical protein